VGLLSPVRLQLRVRLAGQHLEEQLLALLVLEEQLEEERDLREGVQLLEPHAPAGCEGAALPERERGQGHRDDLGHPSLGLELGEEAHLRDVEGGYLLGVGLAAVRAGALQLLEALDLGRALQHLLPVVLQVKDPVELLGPTHVLEELLVGLLDRQLGEVRDRRARVRGRHARLALPLEQDLDRSPDRQVRGHHVDGRGPEQVERRARSHPGVPALGRQGGQPRLLGLELAGLAWARALGRPKRLEGPDLRRLDREVLGHRAPAFWRRGNAGDSDLVDLVEVPEAALEAAAVADKHEAAADRQADPALVLDRDLCQGEVLGGGVVVVHALARQVAEAEVPVRGVHVVREGGAGLEVLRDGGYFALPEGAEHGRLAHRTSARREHNARATSLELPPEPEIGEVLGRLSCGRRPLVHLRPAGVEQLLGLRLGRLVADYLEESRLQVVLLLLLEQLGREEGR
jgi:hypothetical protein